MKKNPWYLEDDFVHKTLSELMPEGVLTKKCPTCGGKVYSVGLGIKRDECSRCGKTYLNIRIGSS